MWNTQIKTLYTVFKMIFVHKLRITISLLLLSIPSFGQSSERPETIVIPVSSLGEVSEVRKQILQNTLEDELKSHFRLISQKRFEEVQERVFEELDYDECTEDQCIILIQEMLQVENVFHLQVIGEENDTQLSLSWRTLDEKRKEEEFCEECGTSELRKMIDGLVEKLIEKKIEEKSVSVVEKLDEGVLFGNKVGDVWSWFKNRNQKSDAKYEGQIINDVPNGEGFIIFLDNSKYEGEFREGIPDGKGTYTWANGSIYVGESEKGKWNGMGTLTYADGKKFVGEWKDDKKWTGTGYDIDGNIIRKWVNGVKQK